MSGNAIMATVSGKRRSASPAACFAIASLIVAGAVLAGFVVLGIWPFGDHTLLIVDSIHQYLPFYSVMQRKLAGGDSLLYSFSGGFGFNFLSTIAYYLASPINLFMAFIPNGNVCDFMDFAILIKLALCGGAFAWKLSDEGKDSLLPIAYGAAYGLSAFMIGYYFNLMWLDGLIALPLIMRGLEKIVERKGSGFLYFASLFYGIWCNYYIGFMLCAFSVLYFAVLEISYEGRGFAERAKDFGTFAVLSVLAGGMTAVLTIPAYMGLKLSESVMENSAPASVKFFSSAAEIMESHMAALAPINVADTQKGQNVYCGIMAIPGAVMYLLDGKTRLRKRIPQGLLAAFLALGFTLNLLNYAWHGFHVQNGLPNRFAFLYVAVMLSMGCAAMRNVKDAPIRNVGIAFGLPILFTAWRLILHREEPDVLPYAATLGLLGAYLLLVALHRDVRKTATLAAICAVMTAEAAGNAVYGMTRNGGVSRSFYLDDAASYRTMIEKVGEPGVWRSEIDRQHMRNAAMFSGATSTVMFNSTMMRSVTDFCSAIGMEARTNKNGYYGLTKIMNDMFGIRYVASPQRIGESFYGMERVSSYGPFDLYRNGNALSIGYVVDERISEWDADAYSNPFEAQNALLRDAAGTYELFVKDREASVADGEETDLLIQPGRQTYLYLPAAVRKIEISTPEYVKSVNSYNDFIYPLNASGEDCSAWFKLTLKDYQESADYEIWSCSEDDYEKTVERLGESQMRIEKMEGSVLKGEVDAAAKGILLITIPNDPGWTAKVDGKKAEIETVMGTFIGIKVDEGLHEIEMRYVPQGFREGAAIGAVCFILACGWFAVGMRRRRRRRKDEENPTAEDSGSGSADAEIPAPTPEENPKPAEEGNGAENEENIPETAESEKEAAPSEKNAYESGAPAGNSEHTDKCPQEDASDGLKGEET